MDQRIAELRRRAIAGDRDAAAQLMGELVRTRAHYEELEATARLLRESDLEQFCCPDGTSVYAACVLELKRRRELEEFGVGRRVRYTKGKTGRARATYVEGPSLKGRSMVPKWAEGIITHVAAATSGRGLRRMHLRVEQADGRFFFTYCRNLVMLDTWEDVDARVRSKVRAADSEADLWASYAKPSRGAEVTMVDQNGVHVTGRCFWVGPDKQAVGALQEVSWRLGVRTMPNARPNWGSGRDVLTVDGARTPQAELRTVETP
jgi:hypothetical protein